MPLSSQPQPPLRALPAVSIAASFASGIGAAMLLDMPWILPVAIAAAVTGLFMAIFRPVRKAGLLLIVAGAGMADYSFSTATPTFPADIREYSGDITESSERGARTAITVYIDRMDGQKISTLKVRLYLDQEIHNLSEGKRIVFQARLRKPYSRHTIPDEITQEDILLHAGIKAIAYITAKDISGVTDDSGIRAMLLRQRDRLTSTIYRSRLSSRSKQFIATILLGDRDAMSSRTKEAFARAGLSHIMALSGMHVAIIAAFMFWLLSPMLLITSRHYRSIAIIILIWGYAILTGLNAPVVRAGIMTTLVFAADLLQRRTFAINSLMVAALVILVFSPGALGDIGFQLSFLAVASIISFADYLNPASSSRNSILRIAGGAAGMSVAAMLSTALVSALHFHSVPLLFLVANIIVGPVLIPVIIAGGIIVVLASMLGIPYGFIARIVDIAVEGVESTADIISSIPWATVEVWSLSGLTVGLLLLTLTIIAIYLRRSSHSRKLIPVAIIAAILTLISAFTTGTLPERDTSGAWYYIPSHDYADIVIPAGDTVYLVSDAPGSTLGARANSMKSRLRDYLRRRNIRSLEAAPDRLYTGWLIRHGHRMIVGNTHFTFLDKNFQGEGDSIFRTDILVVGNGFHGNLISFAKKINPSEVYLSPALNPRLRSRYIRELTDAAINYVDGSAAE